MTAAAIESSTLRTSFARSRRAGLWAVPSVRWAAGALALFLAGLVAQAAGAPEGVWWTLYLACYAAGGWEPAWSGLQALRSRTLDVDLLMIVAAIGAAVDRTDLRRCAADRHIRHLRGVGGRRATRRTEDSVTGPAGPRAGSGGAVSTATASSVIVAAGDVRVGDRVVVRPGERIVGRRPGGRRGRPTSTRPRSPANRCRP